MGFVHSLLYICFLLHYSLFFIIFFKFHFLSFSKFLQWICRLFSISLLL